MIEPLVTEDELKNIIEYELSNIKYIKNETKGSKEGVVKIADLHLGAYVDNLIKTKNFSINILANKLLESVDKINERIMKKYIFTY